MLHKLTVLLSAALVLAAPLASASRSNLHEESAIDSGRSLLTTGPPPSPSPSECMRDGDCNDNLACTKDECRFGTCVNTPRNNVCGRFSNKKNKCLTSICDKTDGCVNTAVAEGTPCQIFQRCERPRCADNTQHGTCDAAGTCIPNPPPSPSPSPSPSPDGSIDATCDDTQQSGGQGTTVLNVDLGQTSGTFTYNYNMYAIPDELTIIYEGAELFSTGGLVSGSDSGTLTFSGASTIVEVTISAPRGGTGWDVTIGCPE